MAKKRNPINESGEAGEDRLESFLVENGISYRQQVTSKNK